MTVTTLDDLRRRKALLLDLAARHGASRLRVFGSVARGEATDRSDIDFLVEMSPGRSLLDLGSLQMALSQELGREVDVISEGGLRPPRREQILSEAQPL